MTISAKVKPNRRNAGASTGPTTGEGKASVATEALQHGLLSWKPVVTSIESEQDWDAHYQRTLRDLCPEGHLEKVLAERIALLLWRLGRVARLELEAIATGLEDAEEAWNRVHASPLAKLADEAEEIRRRLHLLTQLVKAPKNQRLDAELVASAISAAAKAVGVEISSNGEREPDVSLPDVPDEVALDEVAWTAGRARAAMTTIAQAVGESLDDLLNEFIFAVQVKLHQKVKQHKAQQANLERFRRRVLLADEKTMDRVQRYEATLERAILRCLHEFRRLQASRQAQSVPAPVAIGANRSDGGD